jgi:hypothetical protein
MLIWEQSQSGRNIIWTTAIPSIGPDRLRQGFTEFWRHFAQSFEKAGAYDFVRVEIWADSGRVICFAVDDNGRRVANITYQIVIADLKKRWDELASDSIADDEFARAAQTLIQDCVRELDEAARSVKELPLIRYFDTDSDTYLTPQ